MSAAIKKEAKPVDSTNLLFPDANIEPEILPVDEADATANGTTLTVAGDVHSLKGVISSTNLYCGAPIGQNVVDPATFVALSYSNSTSVSGAGTIFGTITGGTQAQFDLLTANQCYIVVFTKIGLQPIAPEIRGQVIKRSGS